MVRVEPKFTDAAMKVLCKRYLRRVGNKKCAQCGDIHETPTEMFGRCSFGRDDFYNLLASLDFLPNSPTLFNAGTEQGTLSGCFKFNVQDSMESIAEVGRKAIFTLKYGGGTGYCLSALRPFGASVKSTHGKACGPVAVLRYYHAIAKMITQGGKRDAAQMAVLSCDHPDVRLFVHCKDNDLDSFSSFNISVACTNKFMEQVIVDGTDQSKLFIEMANSAWKTGDPGIYFIDTSERTNPTPWLGKLDGTNACGETPMLDNEPCNLGSINLSHFVANGAVDFDHLRQVTCLATQYLDEVIDKNFYPDPAIEVAAMLTRKIGLGVMGWADTLALLHIPYDSDEAVGLGGKVMQVIQDESHKESLQLGQKKGVCPAFKERQVVPLRRNAVTTCIAPAGSISVIASCSSGVEPHFSLDGIRAMGDGTQLQDGLRGLSLDGFTPKTAHEIGWKWHIKHQAVFQEYTDLAVSKTINLAESATAQDISDAWLFAWEAGCKGITVYRDKSREHQVQVASGEESRLHKGYGVTVAGKYEEYNADTKVVAHRRKLPKYGDAKRLSFKVGDMEGYLHPGFFDDGSLGELFITGTKQGSTISGLLDGVAILISLAIQYGVPLEVLAEKLGGSRFEPRGVTNCPEIPIASSLLDFIGRWLMLKYGNGKESAKSHTGMLCPECGSVAIFEEGCLHCGDNCGWTRCG